MIPENRFKRRLAAGEQQIGLWVSLPGAYAAEAVAGAGFDWLMFDTEHSPGDPLTASGPSRRMRLRCPSRQRSAWVRSNFQGVLG